MVEKQLEERMESSEKDFLGLKERILRLKKSV